MQRAPTRTETNVNATKKRTIVAVAGAALMSVAGPALAHTHQICTPGSGDPIIQPEPFHDSLPGQSENTRADLDTNPNYGSRGFHPIHESLHLSEGADERAITVVVVGSATCP